MPNSTEKKRKQNECKRGRVIELPNFQSLFAYYANPFTKNKALMNEWLGWMFASSLLPKDHYESKIREASIMTTSYMYPFCIDIRRFERLVKWMTYLFVCDDHVEIGRNSEASRIIFDQTIACVEHLETVYLGSDKSVHLSMENFKPYITCTYYVVEDILRDLNHDQRKRFLQSWHSYCLANNDENELIEKQLMDLDEISKVRLQSGAMNTIFSLIEYSVEIFIPDHDWHDERIQRLMHLCNLSTIFVNDVYSFEKEYLEQNEDMSKLIVNIVGFHVLKYKCSVAEAMHRSLEIIKECERDYKQLADSLVEDDGLSVEIKTFVQCLTAVNGGNFGLSIYCDRYNVF